MDPSRTHPTNADLPPWWRAALEAATDDAGVLDHGAVAKLTEALATCGDPGCAYAALLLWADFRTPYGRDGLLALVRHFAPRPYGVRVSDLLHAALADEMRRGVLTRSPWERAALQSNDTIPLGERP